MKIIISENKIYELTSKYLDYELNDLEIIKPIGTSKGYRQFYKNGQIIMDGIIGKELLVGYNFMEGLKSMFNLDDDQAADVIDNWFQNKYGFTFDNNIVVDDEFF